MNIIPQPGPEHEWLARHVGAWSAKITTNIPGVPPILWSGDMNISMTGGGLWQVMNFRGDMAGKAFSGHGVAGYDPRERQYVQCWVDNMSPVMLNLRGTLDAAAKTLTMTCEIPAPQGGGTIKMRQVTREVGASEIEFAIYVNGAADAPNMRALYKRKGA